MKERKKEELTMIFPSAKVRCFRFKEITLAKWSSVAAGSHGERIRHRRPCVLLPTCCPWHLVSGRRPPSPPSRPSSPTASSCKGAEHAKWILIFECRATNGCAIKPPGRTANGWSLGWLQLQSLLPAHVLQNLGRFYGSILTVSVYFGVS